MATIDKATAIKSLQANAEFVIRGDEIEWLSSDITQPTDDEINTEIARLQILENRKVSYPDIGDQLDDLFHAGAFSTEMTATIQAVKDKYPKE